MHSPYCVCTVSQYLSVYMSRKMHACIITHNLCKIKKGIQNLQISEEKKVNINRGENLTIFYK